MLKFRTEIENILSGYPIGYSDSVLILGSCFADNIGRWLHEHCLDVMSNPFGTLYNPASIAISLQNIQQKRRYQPDQELRNGVFISTGAVETPRYYSFEHHGSFSSDSDSDLCQQLNVVAEAVEQHWSRCQHLIVTWGTAFVYEHRSSHRIVANCHKCPAGQFERRMLQVDEIVEMWSKLIDNMSDKHIIFTVSPIRHIKDTLHGNQLSKATLLLAIEKLQSKYPTQVEYLPIYELMIDDLRDYRFYASDLVHPSDFAIEIVREYFSKNYLTDECRLFLKEVDPLIKALSHRPFSANSEEYRRFLCQNIIKIEQLSTKYPIFTLQNLKRNFEERL